MATYVYQIQGALEGASKEVLGFRVVLCTSQYFETVDVPAEVFDKETLAFLKFRLAVADQLNINNLPIKVRAKIRAPMNRWLDLWVLENLQDGNKRRHLHTDPDKLA